MPADRTTAGVTDCMQHSSRMVEGVAKTVSGLRAFTSREPVKEGTHVGHGQGTSHLSERTMVVAEGGGSFGAGVSHRSRLNRAGTAVC